MSIQPSDPMEIHKAIAEADKQCLGEKSFEAVLSDPLKLRCIRSIFQQMSKDVYSSLSSSEQEKVCALYSKVGSLQNTPSSYYRFNPFIDTNWASQLQEFHEILFQVSSTSSKSISSLERAQEDPILKEWKDFPSNSKERIAYERIMEYVTSPTSLNLMLNLPVLPACIFTDPIFADVDITTGNHLTALPNGLVMGDIVNTQNFTKVCEQIHKIRPIKDATSTLNKIGRAHV